MNDQINKFITEKHVELILNKYEFDNKEKFLLESYCSHVASDKMLGFLCDYWKLKVNMISVDNENKVLSFFIKAISRENEAKAVMVKELKLFDIEVGFYSIIKSCLAIADVKPWSPKFVSIIKDAMVFEDLNVLKYKLQDKFKRFDIPHTLQALRTLARFHASTIIYEETKAKELNRSYSVMDDFDEYLNGIGYRPTDTWFSQCMNGALEAVKAYSSFSQNKDALEKIENNWVKTWCAALEMSNPSKKHRSVICHRDLWNNNIMFHYKENDGVIEPDDCVLIDFQAIRCQPPAGDVMLLLYCNLDKSVREQNIDKFLDHYYNEIGDILSNKGICIDDIMPKEKFLESAEEQRQWALVACSCLIPQFWIDDDIMTKTFKSTEKFNEILSQNKGRFIKEMMKVNSDYKEKVMEVFEEIVIRYCLV